MRFPRFCSPRPAPGEVLESPQDGDAGGVEKGSGATVSLEPGQWRRLDDFLWTSGLGNGWVRIAHLSETAPWLAYGVVNDGAAPGVRTGDGEYVPMAR